MKDYKSIEDVEKDLMEIVRLMELDDDDGNPLYEDGDMRLGFKKKTLIDLMVRREKERDEIARQQEREKNLKGNFSEIDYIQAICYALIKRCRKTNATSMTINQDGVTFAGEPIGDWKITVEALTPNDKE